MVDLLTGEKQQTLSSAFADSLCPSTSLLYLGRTGKREPFVVCTLPVSRKDLKQPLVGLCLWASFSGR